MGLESSLSGLAGQLAGFIAQTMAGGKLVLTVQLLFRSGGSVVKLTLDVEDAPDGRPASPAVPIELPMVAFGAAPALQIPDVLEDALASRISELARAVPRGPLWLRLVRPYGPLGLLPWEARLRAILQKPVLRLPDVPFRATERTDVLENVVLVDPPDLAPSDDAGADVVRTRLKLLVDGILAGSGRSATRVHVFARASWQPALSDLGVDDARILVHRTPDCVPCASDDHVAPWTSWVLAVMEQRGIDALHLLGRAARSEQDACFLLSATPHESAARVRHPQPDTELSADDVALLLNRAGAWSAVFVPATPAYDMPLAFVADDLAHRWHGAVLYLDQETPRVVREAMRLLYTVAATTPPPLEHGFLYCHPDFLQSKSAVTAAAFPAALTEQALVLAQRAPALERVLQSVQKMLPGAHEALSRVPPGWLAATQRFMEKEVLNAARRNSADILRSQLPAALLKAGESVKLDEAKERLLGEVRAVVARYQGRSEGDDK
jgi:hypothetical protein